MNAVTTKPRSQAKPKAAKSDLQLRMSTIHSALDEGHKKLYLAQQSVIGTDAGEPVEVLLTFVTENLLPDAIAPLQQTPLTRDVVEAVYTGMFPALAAIQGVLALARGTVIEYTVREAHDLLDAANSAMDLADMGEVLQRPGDIEPAARPASAVELKAAAAWDDDEIHEVYCIFGEAIAVMRHRAESANTNLLYGAVFAAERAKEILGNGLSAKDIDQCENASAPTDVACDVLDAALEVFDDQALHGAWRLLSIAHSRLDAAVFKASR
jgi:hypothetical protein